MNTAPNTVLQTKFSKPQRLHERGSDSRDNINAILDAALLCHIGYVLDGRPVVTPTAFWRDGDYVYWHGSSASRMLRHFAAGVEVGFTVSLLDALVLARTAFHHSVNYRSVMLFGHTELVDSLEAKTAALDDFIDRLFPGRRAQMRPMSAQEIKATTVIRLKIHEGAAKVRTGLPSDDAEDMDTEIWAGLGVFDHRVQHWLADDTTQKRPLPEPQVMSPLAPTLAT